MYSCILVPNMQLTRRNLITFAIFSKLLLPIIITLQLNTGIAPENNYKRYSLKLTNNTKIGKFLEITPSITFIHSNNDKPKRGAGGYLLNLMIWPSTDDARDYLSGSGGKKLLYAAAPNSEIDNPFFNVNFNRGYDETNRYIATLGVNITPFKWLLPKNHWVNLISV